MIDDPYAKLWCWQFLAEHNVMDYSLLVGVYYETEENKESDNKARVDFAQNNPGDLR